MTLQGGGGGGGGRVSEPTDASPRPGGGDLSDRTRAAIRTGILESLAADEEIRGIVRNLVLDVLKTVTFPPISDAEQQKNVLDLIDQRLQQRVRPDAFRPLR